MMAPVKHGHRVGGRRTPTYITWDSMIARCHRPSHPYWYCYGGRDIQVCRRWRGPNGFRNFLQDLGERPAGMTLDRIRVDGDYTPGNVRWATLKEQRWNRRDMQAARDHDDVQHLVAVTSPASDLPF